VLRVNLLLGLQHIAAALVLLTAGRFAFVEARAWSEPSKNDAASPTSTESDEQHGPRDPAEMVKLAARTREETLKQFTDELASAAPSASAPPAVQHRHIFVDFGPPRSQVYIAGKLVGQTPFGGQISCVEGKAVEVAVLPPQGAPITRIYECLAGPRPTASADLASVLSAGQDVSNLKPPTAH